MRKIYYFILVWAVRSYGVTDPVILKSLFSCKSWKKFFGFFLLVCPDKFLWLAVLALILGETNLYELSDFPFIQGVVFIIIGTSIFLILSGFSKNFVHWQIISEFNGIALIFIFILEIGRYMCNFLNKCTRVFNFFESELDAATIVALLTLGVSLYFIILRGKKKFSIINCDAEKIAIDPKKDMQDQDIFSMTIANQTSSIQIIERVLLLVNEYRYVEIKSMKDNPLILNPHEKQIIKLETKFFKTKKGGNEIVVFDKNSINFWSPVFQISNESYRFYGFFSSKKHTNAQPLVKNYLFGKKGFVDGLKFYEREIFLPVKKECGKNIIVYTFSRELLNDKNEFLCNWRLYVLWRFVFQIGNPKGMKPVWEFGRCFTNKFKRIIERVEHATRVL